jgi:hypothetical chaperone protein
MAAFGVDFGTTNSSLARADGPESARVARFARGGGNTTQTFRSVVYFERDEERQGALRELAGPRGIARYLAAEEPGRFVQSLKSFLAARDFSATRILDREYRLEPDRGAPARALPQAEADVRKLEGTVVVGQPVASRAGARTRSSARAPARRRATAGRGHRLRYEPVAAACHYERALDHDKLILISDFGGGTSDLSLIRVGPRRQRARVGRRTLCWEMQEYRSPATSSTAGSCRRWSPALGFGWSTAHCSGACCPCRVDLRAPGAGTTCRSCAAAYARALTT